MENIRQIMTRDIVTIRSDAPIREAVALMLEHGISGLPVVDDEGHLCGVVSEFSLLAMVYDPGIADQPVRGYMTRDVITVDADEDVIAVADRLLMHRIRRVPVVSQGELVGLVSRRDLLRHARFGAVERLAADLLHDPEEHRNDRHYLHVLVVDDDPHILNFVRTATATPLGDHIRLRATTDAYEAREWISQHRCDLFLTDLQMPGINGLELLRFAKNHNPWSQVVIITGAPSWQSIREAMRVGALYYLVKPLNRLELIQLLHDAYARQQAWARVLYNAVSQASAAELAAVAGGGRC